MSDTLKDLTPEEVRWMSTIKSLPTQKSSCVALFQLLPRAVAHIERQQQEIARLKAEARDQWNAGVEISKEHVKLHKELSRLTAQVERVTALAASESCGCAPNAGCATATLMHKLTAALADPTDGKD